MTLKRSLIVIGLLLVSHVAAGQSLEALNAPELVSCDDKPCFRVRVAAKDADGKPLAIPQEKDRYRVLEGEKSYTPFYIAGEKGSASTARPVYWMLLIDLSGSMNLPSTQTAKTTRFQAARQAIKEALGGVRDGVDRIAIVGFESHGVRAGVKAARFVTSVREAIRQLEELPVPAKQNNTALYTAIYEALDILQPYQKQAANVALVVFTDGKNEVTGATDDKDLLGDRDLERVKERVRDVNVWVKTIGYGVKGSKSFDEQALRELAWPGAGEYNYAPDQETIRTILKGGIETLVNSVQLAFGWVRGRTSELTGGQTLSFKVRVNGDRGALETAKDLRWSSPPLGNPTSGDLTPDEYVAFKNTVTDTAPTPSPWLERLMALGILSTVLAVGWFGLPRLLWPERYIPRPAFPNMPGGFQPPGGMPSMPRGPSRPHMPQRDDMPPRPGPPRNRAPSRTTPHPDAGPESPSRSFPDPPPRQRGRQGPPARDPGDSTIYIPRGKKYEKDS